MSSLFAEDAVIRRVGREGVLVLGGGRALLMQLAHPAVAAAVADHSDFESDPMKRLRATLEATYTIVFGTDDAAATTADTVKRVHDRVNGPTYHASDPTLLCWVNATLTDTALRVYTSLVRPLSATDASRYYEETTQVAALLGCPRDQQPADVAEFHEYVHDMVATFTVTETARRMAHSVLHPRMTVLAEPPLALFRFVTVGMLPRPLREQYGLSWDHRHDRFLRLGTTVTRTMLPLVPPPIRRAPLTYFNLAA
jgi:uncharacterized protein (DUF2236 family)